MKQVVKLCICVTMIVVISGCVKIRTNTKAPVLSDNAVPKLSVNHPVSLRNSSSNSGEIIIGKWLGGRAYGDLYKFTESSIGAARDILERMDVKIQDSVDKMLKLEVYNALSEQGMVKFRATTALRVETGDGLKREYEGVKNYANGYQTTWAIERALAYCVEQMLNDKDIIRYLEN